MPVRLFPLEYPEYNTIPFDAKFDISCNYCPRKYNQDTTQFEDMCILAVIKERISFSIPNNVKENEKLCIIIKPYFPMNELQKRNELMPDYKIMQKLINDYKD